MAELKSRWMTADYAPLVVKFNDGTTGPVECYVVRSKGKQIALLGIIEFCAQWRHWVFVPEAERQFSDRCLSDLAAFLAELNKEK